MITTCTQLGGKLRHLGLHGLQPFKLRVEGAVLVQQARLHPVQGRGGLLRHVHLVNNDEQTRDIKSKEDKVANRDEKTSTPTQHTAAHKQM